MNGPPRGSRLQVGFFGRRNVGKSSLVNALCHEQVSVVSPVAGTTTDPVEKAIELRPLGPVVLIDTAGLDDEGALGELRVARTRRALERVDVAVVVGRADGFGASERELLAELARRGTPAVVALNMADVAPAASLAAELRAAGLTVVETAAPSAAGVDALTRAITASAPQPAVVEPRLAGDLVPAGGLCVLVVPIDSGAPRGRLILPQAQLIRDLLDHDAMALVAQERSLRAALARLTTPPALVVTDSQAFREVAAVVPPEVPLTSFSILMARQKGDLATLVRGALAIDALQPGDRVLIAESCRHQAHGEDIGRVKLPRWLTGVAGGPLRIEVASGHELPAELAGFRLVVHCGGCMLSRTEMLARLRRCADAGVPATNYGLAIATALGILPRALAPFPAVREVLRVIPERQPIDQPDSV